MIAEAVRTRLVALDLASSSTFSGAAWVCLVGGLSDKVSAPQIAVMDRAGLPPQASHGNTRPLRVGLQILIRGTPGSYAATALKTEAVFDALYRKPFGDLLSLEAVNNPIWVGYSADRDEPTWSINFIAHQE